MVWMLTCAAAAPRGAVLLGRPSVARHSFRLPQLARVPDQQRRKLAVAPQVSQLATPPPAITLSERALAHLTKLRNDNGGDKLLLRMGVKSGGCSGMSYVLDFESEENVRPDDAVMEYEGGFKLVCDPKSLLYLFGLQLDYSDALIGGGFAFNNPNASASCGCGKSFGV